MRSVSFRATRIEVEPGDRKVRATVNYSITGTSESRGPRQDQGVWRTEWIGGDAGWRLIGLDCIDASRLESPSLFFHDVSAHALAKNTSLLQQLNEGIGYWAERLDAASQIDLYGLNGIAVGDYDGDGWEDVYVCEPGGLPNRLLRNRGDGTFEDVTAQAGLAVMDSTSAAIWADYDNDGDQDLFVITPREILLFENDGHGHFQRSRKAQFDIPPEQRGVLMMAAIADYDRDGFLDLFVCQLQRRFTVATSNASDSKPPPPPFERRFICVRHSRPLKSQRQEMEFGGVLRTPEALRRLHLSSQLKKFPAVCSPALLSHGESCVTFRGGTHCFVGRPQVGRLPDSTVMIARPPDSLLLSDP